MTAGSAFVALGAKPPPTAAPPQPAAPPVDVAALRAQAFAEGRAAAEDALRPRIAELEAQIQAAEWLGEAVGVARPAALRAASEDLGALLVGVCRRVLGDALALNPDALAGLVTRALERLPTEDEVWIRVPPGAVDAVRAVVPEAQRDRVIGDPSRTSGCRVETRHSSIESTLELVMAGVEEATQAWLASMR